MTSIPLRGSRTAFVWLVMAFAAGSIVATFVMAPDAQMSRSHAANTNVATENPTETGDWSQWGGSSIRNNVPNGHGIPVEWEVGTFDRKTDEWNRDGSDNIAWVSRVGSQTYGNPVVAGGRVFVGTNNGGGYLSRYPSDVDLGCLLAFSQEDGQLLWQHSSEKLPTGRVHDWPLQGICCAPLVEGDRLWFVTSRGEVACLDAQGYHDGEDDGPAVAGFGSLFSESPSMLAGLDAGQLPAGIAAALPELGVDVAGRARVAKADDHWEVTLRGEQTQKLRLVAKGPELQVFAVDDVGGVSGESLGSIASDLTMGLDKGTASAATLALLADRGLPLESPAVETVEAGRQWTIKGQVNGRPRLAQLKRVGPNLIASKLITVDDKNEADTVWVFDMMGELGVSQHNMCSCSVTTYGDILFVNTSNGVDESHINIPNVKAPSFIAMDKNSGKVLWTDGSPGENILHGQWSSPTIAEIGGVPQAIFGGGDGWVYSFRADAGQNGKPELLWKFDANPKTSLWVLGGRGTRNNIIATPVIWNDRVYVAVGQDPEHGEGIGHLWCIDPTKRGDVSPQLAVRVEDRTKVIPHRRLKAVIEEDGEVAIDNPNSAALWHYDQYDRDGDGQISFEETMHRSCGTVAIKDNLLFIADFSGLFHCLDPLTGKVHWSYDLLAAAWGSPLIVEDHVYIGDEDGELAIFELTAEPHEPIAEIDMRNSVYSTPIVSHNTLFISNKTHLFAIKAEDENK